MVDHNTKQGSAFLVACCANMMTCCISWIDDCHLVLHVAIGGNHPVHEILPSPVEVLRINYRQKFIYGVRPDLPIRIYKVVPERAVQNGMRCCNMQQGYLQNIRLYQPVVPQLAPHHPIG